MSFYIFYTVSFRNVQQNILVLYEYQYYLLTVVTCLFICYINAGYSRVLRMFLNCSRCSEQLLLNLICLNNALKDPVVGFIPNSKLLIKMQWLVNVANETDNLKRHHIE